MFNTTSPLATAVNDLLSPNITSIGFSSWYRLTKDCFSWHMCVVVPESMIHEVCSREFVIHNILSSMVISTSSLLSESSCATDSVAFRDVEDCSFFSFSVLRSLQYFLMWPYFPQWKLCSGSTLGETTRCHCIFSSRTDRFLLLEFSLFMQNVFNNSLKLGDPFICLKCSH